MYFKQILDERCGCASYLVASRQTNEAAIVDPAVTIDHYEALLAERHFTLRYIVDTHIHADHVSGGRALAERYGAEICLHETARVNYPFRPLRDGEELPLGQLRLHVIHTPGHRPELISISVINPARSPEASMVLTGDSLLVGDVGRPDFGGGDPAAQYDSVTRLFRLPDWVAVFPGHFEGPCGKAMCGRPSTTIGFERLYNPLARLERGPFLERLSDGIPARPLNMTAIEATNRGLADDAWAMLTTLSDVPEIGIDDVARREESALLLDVREPAEYAHGHVPGAINIPQADLATRLDDLPRDRPVLLICQGGLRSLRAAQFLRQVGFDRVASVAGGTDAWTDAGRSVETRPVERDAPRIVETEWAHAGGGHRG
jgi:hydroxyacylglutathione hydrolase